MAKATHTGTCQLCGNHQKLPSGVLSKHGYTVDFGYFAGTCPGSGHAPFEESCDRIEQAIADALAYADQLEQQAAEYEALTSPDGIWVHRYVKTGRFSGSYKWVQDNIRFRDEPNGYRRAYWEHSDRRSSVVGGYGADTDAGKIAHEREKWATHLRKQAAQARGYANWQRERITNWAPAPLTPIK